MLKTERFLTFYIDSHLCAFKASDVREINICVEITQSLVKVRDEDIPLFDIRGRLGLEFKTPSENNRVIILKHQQGTIATLVDSVHTVIDLFQDQWEALSESDAIPFEKASVFAGIASWKDQTVLLLDVVRVLEQRDVKIIAS